MYLSLSNLLHLVRESLVPSMLLQMTLFCPIVIYGTGVKLGQEAPLALRVGLHFSAEIIMLNSTTSF